MDNERDVTPHECPACGKLHDRVSGLNTSDAPRPGDITVCVGCGAICEFDNRLQMVLVPDDRAKTDPDLNVARKAQARIRSYRGLPNKK